MRGRRVIKEEWHQASQRESFKKEGVKHKLNEFEKLSKPRIIKSHTWIYQAGDDSYADDKMFSFKDVRI